VSARQRVLILGVALWAAVVIASVGGSYALTLATISQRQRVWCPALVELTRRPVHYPADPIANPSRVESYTLYTQLLRVRIGLGCTP
jgi:hypothetical protein